MDAVKARDCALVLVDYQSRLMPAIHDATAVVANGVLLARAARVLDIPALGTEQNPTGLGPNVVKWACPVLCGAGWRPNSPPPTR